MKFKFLKMTKTKSCFVMIHLISMNKFKQDFKQKSNIPDIS